MKRWRRRLAVFAVLVGVVAGAFVAPRAYWSWSGWWRGEPFWRGYPASYYAGRLTAGGLASKVGKVLPGALAWGGPAESWVRRSLGDGAGDLVWGCRSFPDPDAEAVPVLIALLRHPDEAVSKAAAELLRRLGAPAVPALRTLLDTLSREAENSWRVSGRWHPHAPAYLLWLVEGLLRSIERTTEWGVPDRNQRVLPPGVSAWGRSSTG